ncbi:unnamed protein product [Tuber melanosporum]|uniref:(Perigord truffle) hypothetical protein n=1 Tax=Tuber melanosporum (strain Mel28) TaxID=656061 RepID=D5GCD4_TUBMM|nr:uncharacterized protein GSTUM_00005830001 [Tuber melanosporum]CAZ82177.1 unnamed protein product [Tuber melanosporum]
MDLWGSGNGSSSDSSYCAPGSLIRLRKIFSLFLLSWV